MTEEELKEALRDVPGADEAARAAAHAHWARLAKPLGGLGALETLVEDAAALTGRETPAVSRASYRSRRPGSRSSRMKTLRTMS